MSTTALENAAATAAPFVKSPDKSIANGGGGEQGDEAVVRWVESTALHPHQVAGHFDIVKSSTYPVLFKPVAARELDIYLRFFGDAQSSSNSLLQFLPRFLGVSTLHKVTPLPLVQDAGDDVVMVDEKEFMAAAHDRTVVDLVHQTTQVTLHRYPALPSAHFLDAANFDGPRYITIEDLTRPFVMPSVLDLKLGYRSHGLDASPSKVRRIIDRNSRNTSGSHGFKICGAKYVNAADGQYVSRSKEWGRSLDPEYLQQELTLCFGVGDAMRVDVLDKLIQRLFQLESVVREHMEDYRLWSASILVIYENDMSAVASRDVVDVRLVDLAQVAHVSEMEDPHLHENTDGWLWGLDNLIKMLQAIVHNEICERPAPVVPRQ